MQRSKAPTLLVFSFSILFFLFFQFCKQNPVLGPVNPFGEDPFDAVGSFSVQLAVLAAGLALVRAYRPYPATGAPSSQALLILHSGTVALLAVAVTLVVDAIGLARSTVIGAGSPEAGMLATLLGGMAVLNLLVGWLFLRQAGRTEIPTAQRPVWRAILISTAGVLVLAFYPLGWRDASLAGTLFTIIIGILVLFLTVWAIATAIFPELDFTYEDFYDDLAAIYRRTKVRLARFTGAFEGFEKVATSPPVRRLVDWLNPRRHPWNLVILLALGMGILLAAAEAVGEGLPGNWRLARLVLSLFIIMEAAAVVTGYLLLGNYLGIYRADT